MTSDNSKHNTELKFFETIRRDLTEEDIFRKARSEMRDLKDFYIDPDKKLRLDKMHWLKRFFFIMWWVLRGMFFKLTPLRRILLLIGVVLIISSRSISFEHTNVRTNEGLMGGVLILIVLMLELKDKLLARSELEAGKKVQLALMPDQCPTVPGWELWLCTRPANEVGGDLVDFITISDNRFGITIADIAGKGLQAALLTTKLQATIRALIDEYNSLSKLVSKINNIFFRDSLRNIFASLLYVEITPNSNKINYVNAGHLPPVLIKSDSIKELDKGEAALGLMNNNRYTEKTRKLKTGEIFFAYSDGLTEAQNEHGQFFGSERLFKLLQDMKTSSPKHIGERIIFEIGQFIGEARVNDDLSLIILKKLP
jgi:hypothetical protein